MKKVKEIIVITIIILNACMEANSTCLFNCGNEQTRKIEYDSTFQLIKILFNQFISYCYTSITTIIKNRYIEIIIAIIIILITIKISLYVAKKGRHSTQKQTNNLSNNNNTNVTAPTEV